MNTCGENCPRESQPQDLRSAGIIGDPERIARGAFAPSHGDARRLKITNQLIKIDELIAGTCSVYRLCPNGISPEELVEILEHSRPGANLFAVSAPAAGTIRKIKLAEGCRAFCVVDECDADPAGGFHPAHAHISFCRDAIAQNNDREDPALMQAHRDLLQLFRPKTWRVWEREPDQAAA